MPRLRSIGFMPAATALAPSLTMACASTVAVVVPSPAMSEVLLATSRTIWAPMFSNLSSSLISLATVTPSFVIRGAPKDFSSTTLRPLGPSVTRTALARMSTPRSILSRASVENFTSLAAIALLLPDYIALHRHTGLPARGRKRRDCGAAFVGRVGSSRLAARLGLDIDPHDVAFLHDQVLDAVDLDLGARPLAEQHAVAGFDVDRDQLARFIASAGSHGDDLALLRLFLCGIGNDDPPRALFLGVNALDDDAVVKRTEFHRHPPSS